MRSKFASFKIMTTFAPANKQGQLPEWPNGADCNSAGLRLRWFESITAHAKRRFSMRSVFFLFHSALQRIQDQLRVMLLAVIHDHWHVVQSPLGQLMNDGHQRLPHLCQCILHTGWHFRINRPPHQSIGLQDLQRAR